MTLEEKINSDFLTAQKARDQVTVGVLRMVRSALKNAQIEKRAALEDEDVIKVLRREMKVRTEAAEQFEKGGRPEQAATEKKEGEIVARYLPTQMDEGKLRELVSAAITEVGAASMVDMGKVMAAVMPKVAGAADGNAVSAIVKQLLSGK